MKRTFKVVLVVLVGAGACWVAPTALSYYRSRRGTDGPAAAVPPEQADANAAAATATIPVEVTAVAERVFEDRLVLQGNVEAKHYALVAARIGGTLENLYVDEGDAVVAGETKLFDVDSLKLQKTVAIREQDLAVSVCARREKEANAERVEADFNKAKLDYERHKRLLKEKVVTTSVFEQFESRYQQALALRKHARSLVDLSMEQEKQAAIALEIARKDLKDATVIAPLSGTVTKRFSEPGEMAEVGKPVVRIDDLSLVEIVAQAPAYAYDRVIAGHTPVRLRVNGTDLGEFPVTYKSPTVDPTFRSFTVKCLLEHRPEGVVPGVLVDVTVILRRRKGLGVPRACVLVRGGRPVIFAAAKERVRELVVATGLETDNWIEVRGEGVEAELPVVSTGQVLLDPDSRILIRNREDH